MWIVTSTATEGVRGPQRYDLPSNGTVHIVSTTGLVKVVQALVSRAHQELGLITVGPWGVKLEAIQNPLTVIPSHSRTNRGSNIAKYELKPCSHKRSEILILRDGDAIQFPKYATSLTCEWDASEVQVDSSAPESREPEMRVLNGSYEDLNEKLEGEVPSSAEATEIQERTTTPIPQLSNQRSIIVQETPTVNRTAVATELSTEMENSSGDCSGTLDNKPPPAVNSPVKEVMGAEKDTTKHTGPPKTVTSDNGTDDTVDEEAVVPMNNSPQVKISQRVSQKRNSSAVCNGKLATQSGDGIRSNKRAKVHADSLGDTHHSLMNTVESPQSKALPVAKSTKRKAEALDETKETSARLQRNSQRPKNTAPDSYEGPPPSVAVSNSVITKDTQAVKFLKKCGGVFIDSSKDPFNVLCVRDGTLTKTPKLLSSIARGIPIVTDKWLFDSAKAGYFLSTTAYIPSAPKQEQEWNIKLSRIVGHPQQPFRGYTIHFTASLKATYKPFTDIEHVCKAAGAKKVTSTRMDKKSGDVVVLARDEQDPDVDKLVREDVTCYSRDLISQSILRGAVDLLSSEFRIKLEKDNVGVLDEKRNNKRGRKSK